MEDWKPAHQCLLRVVGDELADFGSRAVGSQKNRALDNRAIAKGRNNSIAAFIEGHIDNLFSVLEEYPSANHAQDPGGTVMPAFHLDIDTLSTKRSHFASRYSQPLCVRYTCKEVARFSMDNRVLSPCVDGNRWIARNIRQLLEQIWRQQCLQSIKRPVDGHRPFIAAVVETRLLLKYGERDSCLGAVSFDAPYFVVV
jgi:hypothetical protein